MGNDSMKTNENIYFKCRKEAALYDKRLFSRESAADLLGMSVSSLSDYELGITKVVPVDKVVLMADLYNAPQLKTMYCKHDCPITQYGGYAHAYTPKDTVVYENYVRIVYQQNCRGVFFDGAIHAKIKAFFPIPQSTSKKKRQQMLDGEIRYTKKPDNDNIAKIILDSLNQIFDLL